MKYFFLIIYFLFFGINLFSQSKNDTIFLKENKNFFIEPSLSSVYSKTLKKLDYSDVLKSYVPIYKYENKYYLYAPCDWIYNFKIQINSEKIFFYESDEIEFVITKKTSNVKRGCVKYKFVNPYLGKGTMVVKHYKDIDGVFIIKIKLKGRSNRFVIVADSEMIDNFQVIVNNCKTDKVQEFEFDKIDLEEEFNSN